MKTNYILIDYESVQVRSLTLLKGEHFRVYIFLGPNNKKIPVELVLAIQELGGRAEYIILETHGTNALDFHIAYYLGILVTADPLGFFHIISKDTGFDPLIKHLRNKSIMSTRSVTIEDIPCLAPPASNKNSANGVAIGTQQKITPSRTSVEELIKVAVSDLIKRKSSRPGNLKTLLSTIHAKCGKSIPPSDIKIVFDSLIKRGYVKITGTKVSYMLPSA